MEKLYDYSGCTDERVFTCSINFCAFITFCLFSFLPLVIFSCKLSQDSLSEIGLYVERKSASVGDGSSGLIGGSYTVSSYSVGGLVRDSSGNVVAVVAGKGADKTWFAVGLKRSSYTMEWFDSWDGYDTAYNGIQVHVESDGTYTGDADGSDNWSIVSAQDSENAAAGYFKAFNWANAYSKNYASAISGWYLPSLYEYYVMWTNRTALDAVLQSYGDVLTGYTYWSSSQDSTRVFSDAGDFHFDSYFDDDMSSSKFDQSYCRAIVKLGDGASQAAAANSATVSGSFDYGNGANMYYFTAKPYASYTISWTNSSGTVAVATGTSLSSFSTASASSPLSYDNSSSSSCIVYIKVAPYSALNANAGSFTLTVTAADSSESVSLHSYSIDAGTLTITSGSDIPSSYWTSGTLETVSSYIIYAFNAKVGKYYHFYWDDSYEGSGACTCNVKVSASKSASDVLLSSYESASTCFSSEDSGYSSCQNFYCTSKTDVYIRVDPYSTNATGTFRICVIMGDGENQELMLWRSN